MGGKACLCSEIQSTLRQARLQAPCVYHYCSICSDNPSLCFYPIIFPHHNGNVNSFFSRSPVVSHSTFAVSKETGSGASSHLPTAAAAAASHQLFTNQTAAFIRSAKTQRSTILQQQPASIVLKPL